MIHAAMEYLSGELIHALSISDDFITVGSLQSIEVTEHQGIIMALVNVEQETTLKNLPHSTVHQQKVFYQEPPLSINLRLAIAFDFEQYSTSIQHLSAAANFFHKKKWFSVENQRDSHPFPSGIGKLFVDLENMGLEQLNHIWSISGGVHYFVLFYKIRVLILEQDDAIEGPNIETVELDHKIFSSSDELKNHLKANQENGT